jgi:tRNA(adenine34) deaminase
MNNFTNQHDQHWMQHALQLAQHAAKLDEVPVGAVIIASDNTTILGEGWNCPISANDPTAHAEIIAIRQATKQLGNYRLPGATLYVTLEPCVMCVGAMIHARIKRIVFGAKDSKMGAIQSTFSLLNEVFTGKLNHKIVYTGGVMEIECKKILVDFFQQKR